MKTLQQIKEGGQSVLLSGLFIVFAALTLKSQPVASDVIKVKITGNGYSDETFVCFKDGASVGFEGDKDAWKMFSLNPNVPMIFSKVDGGAVSLNTLPLLEKKVKIDLFTRIKTAGSYTLEARIVSPFTGSVRIFLIDKLLNQAHDVTIDSLMNFSLPADSGNVARFQLFFSTPVMYTSSGLTCFKNQDGKINLENLYDGGWNAWITDENNVYQNSVSGFSETFSLGNLRGGKYFVEIQDLAGVENFEVIIDQPFPVLSSFSSGSQEVCICNGGEVEFTNYSIGGTSYLWDFGDGTKSTSFQPSHIYSVTGEHIVTLAVSNGQCTDTSYSEITVVAEESMGLEGIEKTEDGTLYFDGQTYFFRTGKEKISDLKVEVFNLAGQKIPHRIDRNLSESFISITIPEKKSQLYIFSFESKDYSFTKLSN